MNCLKLRFFAKKRVKHYFLFFEKITLSTYLIFKKSYEELNELLSVIDGIWDESQKNKKVLRLNGGVMNWYESTGTIYFQGVAEGKRYLESRVKSALYFDEV